MLKTALGFRLKSKAPALAGRSTEGQTCPSRFKHSEAFILHLPADVENFSELSKGYLLAEDAGKTRWTIEEKGARIIFPNPKVKNGLRAGMIIEPATLNGIDQPSE